MTIVARPGGRAPEHLWLTVSEHTTMVSVLAPDVLGTAEHHTIGPITRITPLPEIRLREPGGITETVTPEAARHTPRSGAAVFAWVGSVASAVTGVAATIATNAAGAAAEGWIGLAVGAVGVGTALWLAGRRYKRMAKQWVNGYQVLTHQDDRSALDGAADSVRAVAGSWPQLRTYVDLDEPSPVLVRHLWELTMLLGQRDAARELRTRLTSARVGVPASTSPAVELADRITSLDVEISGLDAEITQRREQLRRLAAEVQTFVSEQQALAKAVATIRESDRIRGIAPATPAPAATDLVDYTAAVLAAYRELTR